MKTKCYKESEWLRMILEARFNHWNRYLSVDMLWFKLIIDELCTIYNVSLLKLTIDNIKLDDINIEQREYDKPKQYYTFGTIMSTFIEHFNKNSDEKLNNETFPDVFKNKFWEKEIVEYKKEQKKKAIVAEKEKQQEHIISNWEGFKCKPYPYENNIMGELHGASIMKLKM